MKVKTYFANEMEAAGRKAQYDSEAKKILSDKTILAWILKYTVRELDGYTVEEIRGFMEEDPEISEVLVYPGKRKPEAVVGLPTVDQVPNEGEVTYDIRFRIRIPAGGHVRIIINLEIQNDYYPGYDLVTRAVFYCGRMLSAQLDTEFTADDYDGIQKVYSIWLCLDAPQYAADSITEYKMGQRRIAGYFQGKARYDLLSVVMVCLCRKKRLENRTKLHELLGILFDKELLPKEKLEILERDYCIKTTVQIEEGIQKMGGLGEAIERKGIEQGLQQGLQQGLRVLIETCRELGVSRENTRNKIEGKFGMDGQTAEECMVKYWT